MKKICGLFGVMLFATVATPAHAQATRTWVSGVGDDANPCSRTAPCKTFAGAISKTATNGEINCLDPAGYGAVNITKSITIDCTSTYGSILASNVNGIIINGAGINVILRNLTINGAATTTGNGIRIIQAGTVLIDHVIIENFAGTGVNGRGVAVETGSANARVTIQNSSFANLNNGAILSAPTAGNVVLNVDRVQVAGPGTNGIVLRNATNALIAEATITGQTGAGLLLEQSTATAYLSRSIISHNANGIQNGLGAGQAPNTVLFANSITSNTTNGLLISGGLVFTYGNNGIRGNTGNEAPNQASMGLQ